MVKHCLKVRCDSLRLAILVSFFWRVSCVHVNRLRTRCGGKWSDGHFWLSPPTICPDGLSSKGEDRLFRRLFQRYNQYIRPVENVSDPVTVQFEVSISQLVKVVSLEILISSLKQSGQIVDNLLFNKFLLLFIR